VVGGRRGLITAKVADCGGGVEDRKDSIADTGGSSSFTVLTEGEGGIVVSEETVGGAGAAEWFRAR
jgi:hypothetical protein